MIQYEIDAKSIFLCLAIGDDLFCVNYTGIYYKITSKPTYKLSFNKSFFTYLKDKEDTVKVYFEKNPEVRLGNIISFIFLSYSSLDWTNRLVLLTINWR